MATQEQRREATRTNLVETARRLIVSEGVSGTTTRSILEAANISRGAMYHHFASLEDLIAAVYENESKGAIQRALAEKSVTESPIDHLVTTCMAWLSELTNVDVAKILIIEGPAAIGWERCRKIEEEHSLAQMKKWLEESAKKREIKIESADLVARMLNAVLTEAALSIVKSKGQRHAYVQAENTFVQLISGLRTRGAQS